MNTSSTWPSRTSTTAEPRQEARKPTASVSASTKPSCRNSIRWRSANASTPASSSCRPTSMPGSPGTTNSDHIRGAGATAKRQCKPSLTPSHSPGRNHWPPDVGQTQPFRHQTGHCQIKYRLVQMMGFLSARQIRVFDYPRFAEPLRDRVRDRAAELASAAGVTIEHIAKQHIRKEDVVAKILAVRGDHPGLVHIISAMEACNTYKPWHDKQTHHTFLRPDTGKCLHYYFYFIDAELGLIYLRVPTWCPFRLQFYCNGHSWLARQLTAAGVGFTLADNAFLRIDDWERAQTLADTLSPDHLHRILDHYGQPCCPVLDVFAQSYHWSFMQVEYATDLVFRTPAILKPLYEQLSRQAILTVKAEHVATFHGHKITPQLVQEIGSQFTTRIEGTCVKHRFSKSSIKIYDKFGLVLRIETTTNDVSAFKHYRKVEHRQGPATRALAPVRKTIYSLKDLREILLGCNRRYLEYLSSLDDFSAGIRALDRFTQPRPVNGRNLKASIFSGASNRACSRPCSVSTSPA